MGGGVCYSRLASAHLARFEDKAMRSSIHHAARYAAPDNAIEAPLAPTRAVTRQPPSSRACRGAYWLGGAVGALASTSVAATYLCETAKSLGYLNPPSCKISLPVGRDVVRRIPDFLPQAIAAVLPESLYVTHRMDKLADLAAVAHGVLLRGYPWSSVRTLLVRLPQEPYPFAICDPTEGSAQCPPAMLYDRAATYGARNDALYCIATGFVAGAFLSLLFVHHIVPLTRNVPDRLLPTRDWRLSDAMNVPASYRGWPQYAHQNLGSLIKFFKHDANPQSATETTPLITEGEV